jgi:hypothetical protein
MAPNGKLYPLVFYPQRFPLSKEFNLAFKIQKQRTKRDLVNVELLHAAKVCTTICQILWFLFSPTRIMPCNANALEEGSSIIDVIF